MGLRLPLGFGAVHGLDQMCNHFKILWSQWVTTTDAFSNKLMRIPEQGPEHSDQSGIPNGTNHPLWSMMCILHGIIQIGFFVSGDLGQYPMKHIHVA